MALLLVKAPDDEKCTAPLQMQFTLQGEDGIGRRRRSHLHAVEDDADLRGWYALDVQHDVPGGVRHGDYASARRAHAASIRVCQRFPRRMWWSE